MSDLAAYTEYTWWYKFVCFAANVQTICIMYLKPVCSGSQIHVTVRKKHTCIWQWNFYRYVIFSPGIVFQFDSSCGRWKITSINSRRAGYYHISINMLILTVFWEIANFNHSKITKQQQQQNIQSTWHCLPSRSFCPACQNHEGFSFTL